LADSKDDRGGARCKLQDLRAGGIRVELRPIVPLLGLLFACGICPAQDLAPRAYIITPIHSNAVNLTYGFYDGSFQLDGTVPITGATARVHVSTFSYAHSLNFFGRTASFLVALPYGVGNFHGTVAEAEKSAYRSGLLPLTLRFSVNLIGGPAMNVREYSKWKQKTILGVSIKVYPATGQYSPLKLVNFGANRWAIKPEIGYSRRRGHWILDAYGGVWLFTGNPAFYSGTNMQTESPVGSFEGHLSYGVKPRLWFSVDGNYWFGGTTSVNGVATPGTRDSNSRVGLTSSIPLTRHQSLKLSYSDGAYIRYGGNYRNVSISWQYSWIGRPN